MSTTTSVGDPFLLSSYSLPSRLASSSRTKLSDVVYVTHQPGENSEGYATVAAQGDGIHVLDVSACRTLSCYFLLFLAAYHLRFLPFTLPSRVLLVQRSHFLVRP